MTRALIVNADDFGLSEGVNRGIIESHERGIVTSASLMVRAPQAKAAAEYATRNARLGVGIHVELSEWICRDDQWEVLYQVVPEDDAAAVHAEVWRQIEAFRQIMGRGPDHVDSHQHAHRNEPARGIMLEAARELNVPLRHFHPSVQYCGDFYGQTGKGEPFPQALTVEFLINVIQHLPAGVSEMCCHPGYGQDLATAYRDEREIEVKTLTDPRVREAVESQDVRLCSFGELVG
jgi:predicted glycoside hydrolase/deacetylase ChbG (UPF0249 family)